MSSGSLQRETAMLFATLASQEACGPGTLSLCVGLGRAAVPLAVIGLGGACLVVGVQPGEARSASRQGAVDFVVDGLGEALRILKNELRQCRPVSVAVVGDTAETLAEMVRRGVQPQVVFCDDETPVQIFLERGAMVPQENAAHSEIVLQEDVAENSAARREGDRQLLALLREVNDAEGRHATQWLQVAPRLFPKDRERWYWRPGEQKVTR